MVALSAPTAGAQPDPFQQAFEAIDQAVRRSTDEHRTPGLALAVTSREKVLFERTYGFADLKLRTPVAPDTLFQIGSISKSFTAIALLQLADAERLDLQRPVAAHLPWFGVRSDHQPITAHHLLSHTAGIPANRDDVTSSPYMAWALRDRSTAWPPGTRFHYSNVGYQVLHALLEEVSGRPYSELIRERILEPLGMLASKVEIRHASRSAQAVGYLHAYDDRPPHRSRLLVEATFIEYRIGDGCVLSTAADMRVTAARCCPGRPLPGSPSPTPSGPGETELPATATASPRGPGTATTSWGTGLACWGYRPTSKPT